MDKFRLDSLWLTVLMLVALSIMALACGSPQLDGRQLFADNCARCHGEMADGTDIGPPLVHRL